MNQMLIHRYPITIEEETVTVGTANELSVALDVLQGQYDRAVLEQLRPHLAEIIATPQGLTAILKSLSEEDQLFLIDAVGSKLVELIQNARRLCDLFAMMSSDALELKVLDTLGSTGLQKLVQTAEHLSETLEWLYGRNDRRVLELLGANQLRKIIKTGTGLAMILDALEIETQRVILNALGKEYTFSIINNGVELARLLRSMPAEIGVYFINEMSKEHLIQIINNANDWEYLWKRLETTEAQAMANKLNLTNYAA